jgi:plasmid stabilization system protein ParE
VKAVRYDPEATDEYLAAIGWYFARNRAAADRFVERVLEAETAIREHPPQWSRIEGVPRELDVRRKLVRGLPCSASMIHCRLTPTRSARAR